MSRSGAQGVGATTWPAGRSQGHPPQQGVAPGPLTSQLIGTSPMKHSMDSSRNTLTEGPLGPSTAQCWGTQGNQRETGTAPGNLLVLEQPRLRPLSLGLRTSGPCNQIPNLEKRKTESK